ncbi:hypothetical protein DYY67_1573 [Candidatus Nitrosotalea sp. TS]|nr:hypothetical protein [Candidatus Nitrosotalea sp. TS]
MLEERSSGAILYRESPSGKLYLLLNYPSGHWDFVKGNIEKGRDIQTDNLARDQRGNRHNRREFYRGF